MLGNQGVSFQSERFVLEGLTAWQRPYLACGGPGLFSVTIPPFTDLCHRSLASRRTFESAVGGYGDEGRG